MTKRIRRSQFKEVTYMVEIIAGEKGKGKTKVLIDKANEDIKFTRGTIVYLDKSNKHMYELSNKIRMINVKDYKLSDMNMFLGFIAGIVSQDHDLDKVYLDSFLTIGHIEEQDMEKAIEKLQEIATDFNVNFVISASIAKDSLPASIQSLVSVSL